MASGPNQAYTEVIVGYSIVVRLGEVGGGGGGGGAHSIEPDKISWNSGSMKAL